MSVICSRCSSSSPRESAFCARCGNQLFVSGQVGQFMSNFDNRSVVNTLPPVYMSPQPVFFTVPTMQHSSRNRGAPASTPLPPARTEAAQNAPSIRRALVRRGRLTMHYSWLLEGKYTQAIPVRNAIISMFRQHAISGLKAGSEYFLERGPSSEEHEYIVIQRGIFSIYLCVAPAGRDLYISRATMIVPTLSYMRSIFLCVLLCLLGIGFLVLGSMHSVTSASQLYEGPLTYNFLTSPIATKFFVSLFTFSLLILFIIGGIRSCITWFAERDFWLLLRSNSLSAFQIDEAALLEHTSDSIIHEAVQQLGLDATKIVSPPLGYQHRRRIGRI